MKLRALLLGLPAVMLVAAPVLAEMPLGLKSGSGHALHSPNLIEKQKQYMQTYKTKKPLNAPPDLEQEKVEMRACEEHDFVGGMWKMTFGKQEPASKRDVFTRRAKHHYLSFYSNREYGFFNSAKEITDAAVAQKLMRHEPGKAYEQAYMFKGIDENNSDLVLKRGKNVTRRFNCKIVKKSSTLYKEGDLVLSGSAAHNVHVFEVYRRWF